MKVRWATLGGISLLGAAAAVIAILGLVLSGDGLPTEDQRAEAQTASRPTSWWS